MFCFQCEQTAGGKGCQGNAGVCGKPADTAVLQDELIGTLITLAKTIRNRPVSEKTDRIILEGLFTTITNVNFSSKSVQKQTEKTLEALKEAGGDSRKENIFDMSSLWTAEQDIRSLKSLLLFTLKGTAAYAWHALMLGSTDRKVSDFFYTGLRAIGDGTPPEKLLELILEAGSINIRCMELLDSAHIKTYGIPAPVTVPHTIEKGPFIVVSGHDLHDLHDLLKQTKDKGINIYTHGEMLPAHGYPELKKYSHLKGNFGTAWQNQQKEFAMIPAPVLFTTNCIMPVKDSYADRIFTTAVVSYPGMKHIGDDKDFSPVIKKALELGGYEEDRLIPGINGGKTVVTGFGHDAVLSSAAKIADAVKSGKLSHIFLVGGCDGAKPGRNYYTSFVQQAPADSLIITLACGKYRFNDLDLGTIPGTDLPRLIDMGQCNDAYGAIRVATALAEMFSCSVNELPLSFVLSWYEQKAVCVLVSLLSLGIQNIYLGPTLPAFLSPNVLNTLVEKFSITPISVPGEDMKKMLA